MTGTGLKIQVRLVIETTIFEIQCLQIGALFQLVAKTFKVATSALPAQSRNYQWQMKLEPTKKM